jgi:hypothetical protein
MIRATGAVLIASVLLHFLYTSFLGLRVIAQNPSKTFRAKFAEIRKHAQILIAHQPEAWSQVLRRQPDNRLSSDTD